MQTKHINIPDWMKTPDEYYPSCDKEGFINKSSKSFMRVLSKIHRQTMISEFASPQIKIFFTLINIILVSISKNIAFTYFVFGLCVFRMVFLDGESLKSIFKTTFMAAAFSFLFLLPSVLIGNSKNMLLIVIKIVTSVMLLSLLTHTTNWNNLTKALRTFHMPATIIFLLDITIKYIHILGDTCLSMLEALKLRSVGINKSKGKSASGILGVAYLKSGQMSIDTYDAMICRGFDGEYQNLGSLNFKKSTGKTLIFNILYVLLILAVIYMFAVPLKSK